MIVPFTSRITYSVNFKQRTIALAQTMGCTFVSSAIGVHENMLKRWIKCDCVRKTGSGRKPPYHQLETELLDWIVDKRITSRPVTPKLAKKRS